jgi:hypothetical protein
LWLEYNGSPVRWDAPIGVVLSSLGAKVDSEPWELTAHFQGYPEKLEEFSPSLLQPRVMNSIRAAVMVARGTVNPILKLPKADQLALWENLVREDASAYFGAAKDLVGPPSQVQRIPVRMHWHPNGSLLAPCRPFEDDRLVTIEEYLIALDLNVDLEVTWQSVVVPNDTPLLWLYLHGMATDLFLHLAVQQPGDMYGSVTSLGAPPD